MRFWVYMLLCNDKSYYIGHTDNLEKRISQHVFGEVKGYTSTRLPVTLVFSEEFTSRYDALLRERQIKGWGRKKKEALIRGDWHEVSRLAKSKAVLRQAQDERLRTDLVRPELVEGLRTNGACPEQSRRIRELIG